MEQQQRGLELELDEHDTETIKRDITSVNFN